jgi:hypothetical protein
MIIAQGLVTSSKGFSKYYKDVLEQYNGWIPLFSNQIPQDMLRYSISEAADRLTPCIMEMDIANISGKILALQQGQIIEFEPKDQNIEDDIDLILLPSPLPLSCITKVLFEDKKAIEKFENDSKIRSNVIIDDINLKWSKADQKLFQPNSTSNQHQIAIVDSGSTLEAIPDLPACSEIDYRKIYSYGGMMALLFYFAKNGEMSHLIYSRLRTEHTPPKIVGIADEINLILGCLYDEKDETGKISSKQKIYQSIIDIAIHSQDFKNDILSFLENYLFNIEPTNEKAKSRAEALSKVLKDYELNLIKKTVSQQFEDAESILEKMLLMLFRRDNSDSYIEDTICSFTETEYLVFSMVFGIRDKFSKTPPWLRKYQGLQNYISGKMAEYAHNIKKDGISFQIKKSPKTIWEIATGKQNKKALSKLNITNCVKTEMPRIDFSLKDGRVIYPSFIEPKYSIVNDLYFQEIATRKIDNELYNGLLKP